MGYTVPARSLMLSALLQGGRWVSLHEDDPGENGAHEVRRGDGYMRVLSDWLVVDGFPATNIARLFYIIPPNTDVRYFGVWDSREGGTLLGSAELDEGTHFDGPGTYGMDPGQARLDIVNLVSVDA